MTNEQKLEVLKAAGIPAMVSYGMVFTTDAGYMLLDLPYTNGN